MDIIASAAAWNEELIWPVVHKKAMWNISKRVWVHEFTWLNTPATLCSHFIN
jgi:hypothetical protein